MPPGPMMPPPMRETLLIIYVVCVMIDQIRIMCIEKPLFKVVDKILAKYGRQ